MRHRSLVFSLLGNESRRAHSRPPIDPQGSVGRHINWRRIPITVKESVVHARVVSFVLVSTALFVWLAITAGASAQPQAVSSHLAMCVSALIPAQGPVIDFQTDCKEGSQGNTINPLTVSVNISATAGPSAHANITATGSMMAQWTSVASGSVTHAADYVFDVVAPPSDLSWLPPARWTYTFIPDANGDFVLNFATSQSCATATASFPCGADFSIIFDGVETVIPRNGSGTFTVASTVAGSAHTVSIGVFGQLGVSGAVTEQTTPISLATSNTFSWGFSTGPTTLQVNIDVRPSQFPKAPNALVTVAILSDATFNASTVDAASVRFGLTGIQAAPINFSLQDFNGDGIADLVLHFRRGDTGLVCPVNTTALLTGQTSAGQPIQGSHAIQYPKKCT